MSAEPASRERSVFALRGHTFGEVALAAFALCLGSGVLLLPGYDAGDGRNSIAGWLLTNPGAVFLRNIHYWTAQVFLVGTVLHLCDHLRVATERRPKPAVWLRLTASIPVVGFLMLSGFLLRGDADAQQAYRILHEVITQLPFVGRLAARFLFAKGEQLQVVYLHHAATATIVVGFMIVEHVRRLWPRGPTVLITTITLAVTGLLLSPGLHDGLDPRLKGPWYFLGLQEALHWTARPLAMVAAASGALVLIAALPRLPGPWAARSKRFLLVTLGAYAALCVFALFERGANWTRQTNWPDSPSDLHVGWILPTRTVEPAKLTAKLSVVLGRAEGCLVCHTGVNGLGDAHRPESIGCAACHGGNVFALDATRAHAGLIRIPGNLADARRTCGQAGCHGEIIPRIEQSLMTTMAGVVAVDRRVFGENPGPKRPPHVQNLGSSPADTHLRQLCASCHLGQTKGVWGPVSESSRGGGCNACHLVYAANAARQLAAYEATPLRARTAVPGLHPTLTVSAGSEHCFGCHSRSGRISTNYEGWHELHEAPSPAELAADETTRPRRYRQLEDERFFRRVTADVHAERGLDCIDCHPAGEVMGRGLTVTRKYEQVALRCEDCHTPRFATAATSDAESQKLQRLRQWTLAPGEKLAATQSGEPFVNVTVDANDRGHWRSKHTPQTAELRPPASACRQGKGHDRLSCGSCHTAWAPRCVSCHTSLEGKAEGFDHLQTKFVTGAWQEDAGTFEATPPTLGLRFDPKDPVHPAGVIETFVPGMIMELDRNRDPRQPRDGVFRRLYARVAPHTTRREARSCESCHNDPIALGYGRGELHFEVNGTSGAWHFTPAHERLPADALPADAWIGFLGARSDATSTRDDVRPFTIEEQRRILRVGACLTCHPGTTPIMQQALDDFDAVLARRTPRCAVPRG